MKELIFTLIILKKKSYSFLTLYLLYINELSKKWLSLKSKESNAHRTWFPETSITLKPFFNR